jgi:hypothetical protein
MSRPCRHVLESRAPGSWTWCTGWRSPRASCCHAMPSLDLALGAGLRGTSLTGLAVVHYNSTSRTFICAGLQYCDIVPRLGDQPSTSAALYHCAPPLWHLPQQPHLSTPHSRLSYPSSWRGGKVCTLVTHSLSMAAAVGA